MLSLLSHKLHIYIGINMRLKHVILAIIFLMHGNNVVAKPINIAVAANFSKPMAIIVKQFQKKTPNIINVTYGASGRFYAQISHGAPFDMLFSADQVKIDALIANKFAISKHRFSYAIGGLAFWDKNSKNYKNDKSFKDSLNQISTQHIAIANPTLAPYGKAAVEVLGHLKLYSKLQKNLVYGENISQTYQFIDTGAVSFGFVAMSQIQNHNPNNYWKVPPQFHTPIVQDAIILNRAVKNETALRFKQYMSSEFALNVIKSFGYQIAN